MQASITMLGSPTEIVQLGSTAIPQETFHEYLNQIGGSTFRGDKYHLTNHNCNHFSNEAAQFLTGSSIPQHILDLPELIFSTPMGAMFKPMLEQMMAHFGPPPGVESPHFGAPAPGTNPSSRASGNSSTTPGNSLKDDLDLD